MARSAITITAPTRAGVSLPAATVGDPVDNHTIANDGRVVLLVENTGSTVSRTVTLHLARTVDGFSVAPRTVSVPVGETWILGPYQPDDYGKSLLVDVDNAELEIRAVRI